MGQVMLVFVHNFYLSAGWYPKAVIVSH